MAEEQADNRLYLVVHQAFRRVLTRLVTVTEHGDPAVLGPVVGDRWPVFARLLHHHHEGEDQMFFPAIAAARPDAKPLIDRLEAEHIDLVAKLDAVDAAAAAFAAHPDADHQRTVHDAVKVVQDMLVPHLDMEDADLLPIAAESVDPKEWERLGDEALKALPKHDLPIAVGALDEIIRELPESEWPPPPPLPIRVLTSLFWRRKYQKFVAPLGD